MDFTETQKDLLFSAWALSAEDRGMVLTDETIPDADELFAHGWLEARPLDNGDDVAYFWSSQATTAFELRDLTRAAEASQN